jgi:SAM domain (Sterile alpha motif)
LLDTLPNLDDHRFEDGCRTMDVGSWLRSLGLGQYEAAFRDNKIAVDLLPRLTGAGLKDIGVSALGDRLRLLDAIVALASAKPLANSAVSPPKAVALKGRELSAERRPITILFCDLAGSTSLAAKLDAEDWRNLVNAYLDEASARDRRVSLRRLPGPLRLLPSARRHHDRPYLIANLRPSHCLGSTR